MAMSKEARVLNLSYLTEKGGTKLVRAYFLQRFTDMKPNNEDPGTWTLDMFLKINMETIRSLHLNRRSMQILYPTKGTNTNLEIWDLSLFLIILKTTCHLSTDMRMKLSALKKLRDKLAHLGDSDITDIKYRNYFDKIHPIFETVLKELKDEELEKTVTEMFQKLEVRVIPYTELSNALQEMHRSYEDIKKSEEETRNTVRAEHNETRKKIEKGQTELLSAIENLGLKFASINTRISTEVTVKLKPLNGTIEVDERLTQVLVEMFNEEIIPSPERHDLSIHTNPLRDVIVKAEIGCILLHAKFSLKKMFCFYTDFISGELDIYLEDLEKAAKEYLSFEEFHLEMILYEDDFC